MKLNRENVITKIIVLGLLLLSICFTFFINSEIVFFSLCIFLLLFVFKGNLLLLDRSKYLYVTLYVFLFLIRIGILLYRIYDIDAYFPFGGSDSVYFHSVSSNLVNNSNSLFQLLSADQGLFNKFVAIIYYFFGINQHYMYVIDFLFSELIFLYIYKTAFLISNNKKISTISSFIYYIYPVSLVYATDFMREMSIELCSIVSLYYFIYYIQKNRYKDMFLALMFATILSSMHSGYVGLVFCYMIIIVFLHRKKLRIRITTTRILFLCLLIIILMASPLWNLITSRFHNIDSINDAVDIIANGKLGNSYYLVPPQGLVSAIIQFPLRFFYYLNAPLPWHVRSFETLIALIADAVPRWIIFRLMIKSFLARKEYTKKDRMILLFLMLCEFLITFTFCWGTNNYGTAMRHRAASLPIEIMIFYTLRKKVNSEKKIECF